MAGYFGDEDEQRDLFSTVGGGYYYPEADLFLPDIDPEDSLDDFEGYEDDEYDEREFLAEYGPTHYSDYDE